jgi:DNA ligase-4
LTNDNWCRIILDGEMLVWDPISERNLPFGTLKTAALGEPIRANHIPSAGLIHDYADRSKKEHNPRPSCMLF